MSPCVKRVKAERRRRKQVESVLMLIAQNLRSDMRHIIGKFGRKFVRIDRQSFPQVFTSRPRSYWKTPAQYDLTRTGYRRRED